MIDRYECAEIADIWREHSKFTYFLKAELALIEAMEDKLIPKGISKAISGKVKADPKRIHEIEKEVKHDVIAFCQSVTENLPHGVSKYFHFGCTSSDIIDTALSLQIKASLELILKQYKRLLNGLRVKSKRSPLSCLYGSLPWHER